MLEQKYVAESWGFSGPITLLPAKPITKLFRQFVLISSSIVHYYQIIDSNILDGELEAELDTEWLLLADDPLPLFLPLPLSIFSGVTETVENV